MPHMTYCRQFSAPAYATVRLRSKTEKAPTVIEATIGMRASDLGVLHVLMLYCYVCYDVGVLHVLNQYILVEHMQKGRTPHAAETQWYTHMYHRDDQYCIMRCFTTPS